MGTKLKMAKNSIISKNALTVEQIAMMCGHVDEMMDAGITLNLAIRSLETAVDATAKHLKVGHASPHSVNHVPMSQWSKDAKAKLAENAQIPSGHYLRVEHGTPRRALARLVLELHRAGNLSKSTFDGLIDKHWKLAVITHEEDRRLERSTMMASPDERWAAAGIKF